MRIQKKIDELTIEEWYFINIDFTVYLNSYKLLKKESARHKKYHTIKSYERLYGRNSNIEESEVPFTKEIKNYVFDEYCKKIKVLRWSEKNII